ncbi:MAG: LemA family protein [Lachnospiraceae bacterium]|nr:LemA family protein [Lachnospiraceae bacterium]
MKKFFGLLAIWAVLAFIIGCLFALNDKCIEPVNPNAATVEEQQETQLKKPFLIISMAVSLVLTLGGAMVPGYNKVQKTKASIPSLEKDVAALDERRAHQLEQANKVLDKYLAHESAIQIAMANSRIDNGAQFKAVIEKYPELSGNQAVASLMSQITKVEDDLVKKKYQLNNVISEYNGAIHSFPLSLIRKLVKLDDYVVNAPSIEVAEEEIPVSDEDLGI